MAHDRAVLARAEAEAVLSVFEIPGSITGTSPTRRVTWCEGEVRNLQHDHWAIRTGEDEIKRNAIGIVHFDGNVHVGGIQLGADCRVHDQLTKKLLVLGWLTGSIGGRSLCGYLISALANKYDWLLRHRLSLGIERFSDWRQEHLIHLFERVAAGPSVEIVPICNRIQHFAQAALETEDVAAFDPPKGVEHGMSSGSRHSELVSLAREIGVTTDSLRTSKVAVAAIEVAFGPGLVSAGSGVDRAIDADGDRLDGQDVDPALVNGRAVADMAVVVTALADLSASGGSAHDPLGFEPDLSATPARSILAEARSAPRGNTLSPAHLVEWVACASTWVVEYSDLILSAYQTLCLHPDLQQRVFAEPKARRRIELSMALDSKLPPGMPRVLLCWRRAQAGAYPGMEGRLIVPELLSRLYTACLIAGTAFGACSMDEFAELQAGCVSEPTPGNPVICFERNPDLREFGEVPFPEIGRKAIQVLEAMTAGSRALSGGGSLNVVTRIGPERPGKAPRWTVRFPSADSHLRDFAASNGLPMIDRVTGVTTTSDQFKRAFIVTMMHVVPGATDDVACRMGRLADPVRAREYVHRGLPGRMEELRAGMQARARSTTTSAAEGAWWRSHSALLARLVARNMVFKRVLLDARVARLMEVHEGKDIPGGRGGSRLVADLAAEMRDSISIGPRNDPDAVRETTLEVIRRFAEGRSLERVTGGHTHCTCLPNSPDLATARCVQLKRVGHLPWEETPAGLEDAYADFSRAGILTCLGDGDFGAEGGDERGGCPHAASFPEDRRVIAASRGESTVALEKASSAAIRMRAETLLAEVDVAMANATPRKEC